MSKNNKIIEETHSQEPHVPPHPLKHKRDKFGIELTKEVKDLYRENVRTLQKKVEDDTRRKIFFNAPGLK